MDSTQMPDGTVVAVTRAGDPRFGAQARYPSRAVIRLPSSDSTVITSRRVAAGLNAFNPFVFNQVIDSTRVNGRLWRSIYDRATQRVTDISPSGRQSFTTLDSLGRVRVLRTPGLDSLVYSYDPRGRLSQVQTGGRVASYTYDALGRLATMTDPLGRTDSLFYDSADRLIRQVLPGGREIGFAYDSSGNHTGVTPPAKPAHLFSYTSIDLDSVYTPPSLGAGMWATQYHYDLDRQLTQIIRPDGVTIGLDYEPLTGRPSAVTFDRGTVGFGYSGTTGQLTGLTGPDATSLAFTYDGFLPKTVRWGGPVAGSVGVDYDSDFRVTSQTVNGADTVSFGYDADGLLTAAGALGIQRSAVTGFVERDSLAGILGEWGYDPKGALASYTASSGADTLFRTSYARDSLSRITELTETIQGVTSVAAFTYDSAGRLETVTRDAQLTAVYEYDANGNRLSLTTPGGTVTGVYDDQDRLLSYGSATYAYTANGELREKVVGTDTTRYTYDALGNLTGVRLPDGTLIEYVIDPQNRRIGKKVNGVFTQRLVWQGQLAPAAELDGAGAVVSRFVYATRVNVPDYIVKGGQTYRLVLDHLGSVRLVVNAADGTVVQRIDYDEFGQVTQNTNPGFQPFGFAGGLYDDQTNLVRFGARDYDAESGRWTAKDPIGMSGGPNYYAYVMHDPINRVDPVGLDWLNTLSDVSAGFGDMVSLGLTARFRQGFGYDDIVNKCGAGYKVGELAAAATTLLMGGASVARGALAMGGRTGGLAARFARGVGRFFRDGRTFGSVSRQYWRARGGAGGMHLHHWFLPQRWARVNAGWNLLELPAGLNSLMNGSGLVANSLEWGLRLGIPGLVVGGAAQGVSYGLDRSERCQCP